LNIGKFGTFHTKSLIGRPYYLTYDILDKTPDEKHPRLRVVPASELNSETISVVDTGSSEDGGAEGTPNATGPADLGFDIVGEHGELIMRNNRLTIDDPSRQALTLEEIEELKKAGTGSGKDVIAKIMAAHSALGEKTTFSLAKYTLRKSKKYLKRFQVLPMDVGLLTEYMLERDGTKIMDLRPDLLGLLCSWANVHHVGNNDGEEDSWRKNSNRILAVDDTGGLVVAAIAERMGLLDLKRQSTEEQQDKKQNNTDRHEQEQNGKKKQTDPTEQERDETAKPDETDKPDTEMTDDTPEQPSVQTHEETTKHTKSTTQPPRIKRKTNPREMYQTATKNTITLVHPATQPNLSMLKYFNYSLEDTHPDHPLFANLKSLTWLQLTDPESDSVYAERPQEISDEVLDTMKSGKRGAHYRKLRRWQRIKAIVDDTKQGGFDGLVLASYMEPAGILKHLVPLVKGGGQIVVYSPHVEPLTILMDMYSRERRTAYIRYQQQKLAGEDPLDADMENDFLVNPTLLLNPMLQTARAIEWQVLPGRTHPLMMSKGGPEGYIFSATRVIPFDGAVNARGKFQKKRKAESDGQMPAAKKQTEDVKSVE